MTDCVCGWNDKFVLLIVQRYLFRSFLAPLPTLANFSGNLSETFFYTGFHPYLWPDVYTVSMSFEIGTRVETEKMGKGRVAFCGEVQFSDGEWVGVVLDEPRGKNNGSVQGVQYFACEPNHGVFIRPSQLKPESSRPRVSGLRTPANRKDVQPTPKGARSSPRDSPKVSPSVSLERLSKTPAQKVASSSKLADAGNEPKVSQEIPSASQANSEENEKLEKSKQTEKPSVVPAEKPESVMDKVKKLQETGSPLMPLSPVHTTIPAGMDEGTEQEYLRLQVKDLNEKLATLRLKRKEDHAKLVDYERSKIQLQSLMELKSKMADQILDLQRQLQEARKEALESREWREANQDDLNLAAEQLEMATIDKEMAEERAEALQSELDSLKLRNEELEADLEILRNEMAADGGAVISEGTSVHLKQLEMQNERLKEALIKMRDINAAAQADKVAAVREAEILRTENVELLRAADIARKTVEDSDMRIRDYQEQIEAAMGAEEMVMNLANKNMEMETQIRQLEAERDELEAHRDMDEQMFEEQKLVEKALLGEIEALHMKINELQIRMKQEEDHRDELVSTIMKFRKKVGELNEEIQDLKDQVLKYQEELLGHKSEESSMASIASQMQVNANRTFAESIERQILGIELEFARKEMGYLKQFLPDNFAKAGGDNDAVILNVLFSRLSAKAKLLSKLVAERFPEVPGGARREHVTKSHKAEQWAHSARISYTMSALVAVCGQFESALTNISLEDLARLAQLQPEMSTQEKVIDGYLELLRQARLDAETSLENMDKVLIYFQNVLSVNVSADCYDTSAWLRNTCQQLVSGISWCKVNNQRISFFLMPGMEGCDVSKLVDTISSTLAECEMLAIRAGKRVPTENCLNLTPQANDDIQSTIQHLERLALILHETCSIASVQINMNPELDGFESTRLKEMIHGEVEKVNGSITLERAYEPISKYLSTIRENLSKLLSSLDDGSMEVDARPKGFPPVLERAHLRKQGAAEAESLRWQLEKKDVEILELKKTIKSRIDDISNYKLRLNMAEARIESAGKQDNVKMQHLEAKIEQLVTDNKKKQIEFDETMDALQKELKESERENAELKQMAKNFSRKTLLENIQRIESRAAMSSAQVTPHVGIVLGREESQLTEQQLADSRDALRRATLEIIELKAALSLAQSHSGVMRLPDMVCGPETLRMKENDAGLETISKEVEQLKRDELKYLVYIRDPLRPRHLQEQDRIQFEKERNEYNYKVSTLRTRLHQYWKGAYPGQPFPSLFRSTIPNKASQVRCVKYGSQDFMSICNKLGVKVNDICSVGS
ncbi:hypothetical protein KIN20_007253 [Parelaphostrongylus tenuis]|uniref:Dynactin subunit 1 n=1 Tax=Parelaphostrongylus tenuis TaxID=148309 RepID=A0AAD5M330_PARTN|nr:hypothetical protein KIN20_007253 [Parelaphostrongylus tenuis]